MIIRGVVFDVDGVLIDTEHYQWKGWVEPLKKYGKVLDKEAYIKSYAGKTGAVIDRELIEAMRLSLTPGTLLREKEVLLLEWFRSDELKFLPYTREAIRFVQERRYAFAAVSGAPREETQLKLQRTGLSFPHTITSDDVQHSKPAPDPYLLALRKLDLPANQCIAVEDTQYGVESAVGAGIPTLAIPTEFSASQDFSKATAVLTSLKEVCEWIEENARTRIS
ncbi:MAG: HAD family phosphatase [Candidatus Aenigmarchaeota archaeon]|nr:HAD family phosphatase [Candidatus Aenigmarchaeota archaeon]